MPRPNWFFAFPIDGAFLSALPAPPPGFRLFPQEDVHLTLAFLGGCGEAAAERALGVLDRVLPGKRVPPIAVSLGEVVPMGGSRRDYTALSALLEGGREPTTALIAALRDELHEAATGRREKRAPKPHVTLGRPQRRADAAHREAGLGWARTLDLRAIETTLDRIALYTWHEDRKTRLFRIVAERPL